MRNRRTNYSGTKDVTEFDAAEETDVIFRIDGKSVSELIRKNFLSPSVLIDIRPGVDRPVKTEPVEFRRRRRGNLLVDLRPGLHRSGDESNHH